MSAWRVRNMVIPASTSGTIHFDAFQSQREEYMGPLSAATLPAQVTPVSLSSASFQPVSYHPSSDFSPVLAKLPLPNIPLQQPTSLTIDYSYDALLRLTSATYSDGRSFGYTYDPAGNVLELQKNLGPGTVITTYTYDTANELQTALENGVTWPIPL